MITLQLTPEQATLLNFGLGMISMKNIKPEARANFDREIAQITWALQVARGEMTAELAEELRTLAFGN